MKNLKSFKIFETTQDKLGEIQDLIEIEILDEYDSELIILGMGEIEEDIQSETYGEIDRIQFPNSKKFSRYNYYKQKGEFSVPIDKNKVGRIVKYGTISNFIMIIIDLPLYRISDFGELYQKFRSLYKRISSMSGLKLFNSNDRDFEFNGIVIGSNDFDITLGKLKLDWEENNEDKVENMVSRVKIEFSKSGYAQDEVNSPIASFVIILK